MKLDKQKDSIDRMKLLFEYHFKSNGSQRDVEVQEENPVKFNEIGDKYSNLENDFPTFSEYRDEVVIDEDEPVKPEQPEVPQEQPQAQAEPAPQPQQEPVPAPAPPPVAPQPTVPQDASADLEMKLNDQISKTDQMLQAIAMIQQTLSQNSQPQGGLDVNAKIDQVAKEVEDIKNPSPAKQFDMISKNSYPYNIKLSDYWGWEDATEKQNPEGSEYTITQADIDNYDPNLIKQSLNLSEQIQHISDIK